MTEKQFKLFVGNNYGVQKVDGEVIFDSIISMAEADVLVDLLNDLSDENEKLKFENNELKCALALDSIDYIIADGKKIDIPPYYEFENRYKNKKYRREEYDEYW